VHRVRFATMFVITCVMSLLLLGNAGAANVTWTCSNGSWTTGSCWSSGSPPTRNDIVFIAHAKVSLPSKTTVEVQGVRLLEGRFLDKFFSEPSRICSHLRRWQYLERNLSGCCITLVARFGLNPILFGWYDTLVHHNSARKRRRGPFEQLSHSLA
jgi:hypothetical protein